MVKAKSDFLRYLKEYNQQSSFISLAGSSEVLSEINSYKLNNSFGILVLSSKISQLFHDAISEQVTLIANLSFAAWSFPSALKQANVIPILKSDDNFTSISNYRKTYAEKLN